MECNHLRTIAAYIFRDFFRNLVTAEEPNQVETIDNLLNLDDEAFGRALDNTVIGSQPRSNSLPVNYFSNTMSLQNVEFGTQSHNQLQSNPLLLLTQNPFMETQLPRTLSYDQVGIVFCFNLF
jgi:hypothetical protein